MPTTRLESQPIFQGLAKRFRRLDPESLRRAKIAALRYGIEAICLKDEVALEILKLLETGQPVPAALRDRITALAEESDEAYFNAQDEQAASAGEAEDPVLPLFSKARLLSAFVFALDKDPRESTFETVYEVSAAIDQGKDLIERIEAAL